MGDYRYAGFWIRVVATIIDSLIVLAIATPILLSFFDVSTLQSTAVYSEPVYILINYVLPGIAIILFWIYKSATPGKMVFGIKIIDAKTGGNPSKGQLIGRYFSYYISTIPLFLGLVWVGIDKRKQGWHDKIAGTLVIQKTDEVNSSTALDE